MTTALQMTATQVNDFIAASIPAFKDIGCRVEDADGLQVRVRQPYSESQLRPGGSISGPTMMALADTAMYALILSRLGPVALAVTQNLNINFLRKPRNADLLADARFLRLGKRAAVIEVLILVDGEDEPVAHVTGTYAIPEHAIPAITPSGATVA